MAKSKNNIRPIMNWGGLLVISMLLTGIGSVFVTAAPYAAAPGAGFIIGMILLVAALVSWLFFIKNMIIEAVVKALEIFHGRDRAIE